MKICQGCGGVLGRDCFNEQECIGIDRNQNQMFTRQELDELVSQALAEQREVIVKRVNDVRMKNIKKTSEGYVFDSAEIEDTCRDIIDSITEQGRFNGVLSA